MLHDETFYPEPFNFRPERFMKDGEINPEIRDPDHACWGFGRRLFSPLNDVFIRGLFCGVYIGYVLGVTWLSRQCGSQ